MKFQCNSQTLQKAASAVAKAVASDGSARALCMMKASVSGNLLTLESTDKITSLRESMDVENAKDGSLLIPPKIFLSVLGTIPPGTVSLDSEDSTSKLRIQAGESDFSIRCLNADEYPAWPDNPEETVTVSAADLSDGMNRVLPCTKKTDAYMVLSSVLLTSCGDNGKGLRMVATDSYRLALIDMPDCPFSPPADILVSDASAQNIADKKTGDMKIGRSDKEISVEHEKSLMITRTIDGTYPNYEKLLPDKDQYTTIVKIGTAEEKQRFLNLLTQARIVAPPDAAIRLTFQSNQVTLFIGEEDSFKGTMPVDFPSDEEFAVWFNPLYLAEAISGLPGEKMAIYMLDNLKPAMFKGDPEENFLHILMPIRRSDSQKD